MGTLGIKSFGASVTTMEEVFMKYVKFLLHLKLQATSS